MDPALYTTETFTPYIGTQFDLRQEGSSVLLQLIEVRPGHSTPQLLQFALVFQGPLQPALPQHLYDLRHSALGDLSIFLVPVGVDEAGMLYEAVFNRFIPSEPAR